jgi:hypothetical protein
MQEMAREMGALSGRFEYAEGWRRHNHLGLCAAGTDPLGEKIKAVRSPAFEVRS